MTIRKYIDEGHATVVSLATKANLSRFQLYRMMNGEQGSFAAMRRVRKASGYVISWEGIEAPFVEKDALKDDGDD